MINLGLWTPYWDFQYNLGGLAVDIELQDMHIKTFFKNLKVESKNKGEP